MTTTIPEVPPTMTPAPTSLDEFFEQIRTSNPFAVNRVVPSAVFQQDAESVHGRQFAQLVELAGKVQKQDLGIGVLLWGEAGIGKSHLLARLGKWAGPEHQQAVFVSLSNLQAGPEQLPRSLLKCVVSILTRGRTSRFHETRLYRMVNATIRHALKDDGSRVHSWTAAERSYERLVDDLCDRTPAQAALVDRDTYTVLFRLYRSAYLTRTAADDGVAALALRWLSGDYLDAGEAKTLGVCNSRLTDDEQIRKVLIALAQLASYRPQPLVLCFDQVDNLEPEQCGALARFLHALLDSAANLLVVASGVRATLLRWQTDGVISKSTWDRLGQYEVELQRISVPEARQVVQAHLQPFQEPFMSLPPVKDLVHKDYLFPLGERWAREFFADKIDVRPRDAINWAREGWQREQQALSTLGGAAWLQGWESRTAEKPQPVEWTDEEIRQRIDETVARKLHDHQRQRRQEPERLPPDSDNMAGLLHTLLERCLDKPQYRLSKIEKQSPPKHGQSPALDLILGHRTGAETKESHTGVLCLTVSNRNALAAHLRRLVHSSRPLQRLVLVTDERRPLDPAAKGAAYLETLRHRHKAGFHHFNLTFAQYAELDALQAVVGLARSGDLEIELPQSQARRVTEQEVIESHHRCRRHASHPLLRLLLGGG